MKTIVIRSLAAAAALAISATAVHAHDLRGSGPLEYRDENGVHAVATPRAATTAPRGVVTHRTYYNSENGPVPAHQDAPRW